eukprot:547411_1
MRKHHYAPVATIADDDESEDEKYVIYSHQLDNNLIQRVERNKNTGYINDYITCGEDIAHCAPIKRIIHLLRFYKIHQETSNNYTETKVDVYAYMIKANRNYAISTFMDDWHHCKTKHIKTEKDREWFKNNPAINCNFISTCKSENCIYIGRNQRKRGDETYSKNVEIDHKNIILRDQIDSIHTYIFHSSSARTSYEIDYKIESILLDEDSDNEKEQEIFTAESLIIEYLTQKIVNINDAKLTKNRE